MQREKVKFTLEKRNEAAEWNKRREAYSIMFKQKLQKIKGAREGKREKSKLIIVEKKGPKLEKNPTTTL